MRAVVVGTGTIGSAVSKLLKQHAHLCGGDQRWSSIPRQLALHIASRIGPDRIGPEKSAFRKLVLPHSDKPTVADEDLNRERALV